MRERQGEPDIRPVPVPISRVDWEVIWHFALSINGYETRKHVPLQALPQLGWLIPVDVRIAQVLPQTLAHQVTVFC